MTGAQTQKLIDYWIATAEHDRETMPGLFKLKRYSDCLFYGHIILEKILKAWVVKNTGSQAPRIHDLARLEELARLGLLAKDVALLKEVNNFNIRARYPDFKLRFYKMCTRQFTAKYKNKIEKLYLRLCQNLKQDQ